MTTAKPEQMGFVYVVGGGLALCVYLGHGFVKSYDEYKHPAHASVVPVSENKPQPLSAPDQSREIPFIAKVVTDVCVGDINSSVSNGVKPLFVRVDTPLPVAKWKTSKWSQGEIQRACQEALGRWTAETSRTGKSSPYIVTLRPHP